MIEQCGPESTQTHAGQRHGQITRLPEPLLAVQHAKPLIPRRGEGWPRDATSLYVAADAILALRQHLCPRSDRRLTGDFWSCVTREGQKEASSHSQKKITMFSCLRESEPIRGEISPSSGKYVQVQRGAAFLTQTALRQRSDGDDGGRQERCVRL